MSLIGCLHHQSHFEIELGKIQLIGLEVDMRLLQVVGYGGVDLVHVHGTEDMIVETVDVSLHGGFHGRFRDVGHDLVQVHEAGVDLLVSHDCLLISLLFCLLYDEDVSI